MNWNWLGFLFEKRVWERVRSKMRGSWGEEGSLRAWSNKIRNRGGRRGGRKEGEYGKNREEMEGGFSEKEKKKERKSKKKERSKSKLVLKSLKRISDQV